MVIKSRDQMFLQKLKIEEDGEVISIKSIIKFFEPYMKDLLSGPLSNSRPNAYSLGQNLGEPGSCLA